MEFRRHHAYDRENIRGRSHRLADDRRIAAQDRRDVVEIADIDLREAFGDFWRGFERDDHPRRKLRPRVIGR